MSEDSPDSNEATEASDSTAIADAGFADGLRDAGADRTALVTGATGFLGSYLCPALVERGWTVHALRRPTSDVSALDDCPIEWFVGDVCDPSTVATAVAGCDDLFHLAGVSLADADPETVRHVNVQGTRAALDAAVAANVDRFLFTSTAGTRRTNNGVAADETDLAPPIGAYQTSKARAEGLVEGYAAAGGDAVVVHPTSIFGPGDERFTGRLCSMATDPKLAACPPGGASIVSVDDVVDGVVAAIERGTSGESYLLGGQNLPYRDAVTLLAELADGHPPKIEVPAAAVRAAGPIAGVVGERTGRRVFPFDSEMAKLVTSELFYTSEKARRELGYDPAPLCEHAPAALEWYLRTK